MRERSTFPEVRFGDSSTLQLLLKRSPTELEGVEELQLTYVGYTNAAGVRNPWRRGARRVGRHCTQLCLLKD
jgi:hypothetical protein